MRLLNRTLSNKACWIGKSIKKDPGIPLSLVIMP